jgi:hypothetical protein
MLPRSIEHSRRTSEPSGAIASGVSPMRLVSKSGDMSTEPRFIPEPVALRWPLHLGPFPLTAREKFVPAIENRPSGLEICFLSESYKSSARPPVSGIFCVWQRNRSGI